MNGSTGLPMDEDENFGDEPEDLKDSAPVDSDDSSDEPEEDEEEIRRVQEGFIVDEEDEEEESDEEEEKRRKSRKRRKRARDGDDVLEEDDLDLVEENTGLRVDRQRLTRIRRIRSTSPVEPEASGSYRRSSHGDVDDAEPEYNISGIWEDNDRQGADLMDDDMDDFIDDDEQDEGMAQEEREERRKEKKRLEKERQRALGSRPELTGIDAMAWDEIYDVFGDGTDYDWALEEDEAPVEDELRKSDLKYADVFEPSEIQARMLTDEDDIIRLQDVPERMQLASSTLLPSSNALARLTSLEADLDDAAAWITGQLSERHEKDFFRPDAMHRHLLPQLIQAVTKVISLLFVEHFEVPYIWTHKRDYLNFFDPDQPSLRVEFLNRGDLWRIYDLGRKFQALLDRRKTLEASYEKLNETNEYYENKIRDELDSVEAVADTSTWLGIMYRKQKQDHSEFQFHDDDPETRKRKLPSRISDYEVVKNSIISRLAEGFGLKSSEVVTNYRASDSTAKDYFVDDQELPPSVFAEAFGDPNQEHLSHPDQLLQQARMLLAFELGKDPLLRKDVRVRFKLDGLVSINPTEKGLTKIDEHHPYHQFKYLKSKPVRLMLETPQFLLISEAELEHLITVNIELSAASLHEFESSLISAFSSDGYSDTAKSWNEQRAMVIREALDKHLIPAGIKWIREFIREEAQSYLARRCGRSLYERINVKGFAPAAGERLARVIAVSWGKGDPQKDAITLVYLDDDGILRDNIKIDNLSDEVSRTILVDLVSRREPAVVVVGGMAINTTKLAAKLKEVLSSTNSGFGQTGVPVIYGFDEVARMYQHSKRADEEFSALSLTARYCVGLARYIQHPLNEYAALGEDLCVVTFDDECQNLIHKEKLLFSLERTLVDAVNEVGVDINRAVTDPYFRHMLPFVSGLGPRKAQTVVKKIASLGGNLINRQQFIRGEIMTTRIFENSSGFLRISQSAESRMEKVHAADDSDHPDPLDDTRIHPEDYELARKMAADALDLDEEDIQDEHASYVVSQIMQAQDGDRRLNELNLDDFAVAMYTSNGDLKRHTLNAIRDELLRPFADHRPDFTMPSDWDILTMLTSETEKTLRVGLIVSVMITRLKSNYVIVRLDSGIEGVINAQYLVDFPPSQPPPKPDDVVKKGQTILGVIIDVKLEVAKDDFSFELSARQSDVAGGDTSFRRVVPDTDYYDTSQAQRDLEMLQRKKRSEGNQARRVVKHPNFHNFTAPQAEAYLAKQLRGDAVVRPSSKGVDHLAVTWKVDDGLYQHIDVVEPNADATQQTVGKQLFVDKYEFADLDELIVNHVQALARRVEELMAHEKYKRGTDEAIRRELDDYLAAHPSKSIYCFTLNRKRPGHFNLVFKANDKSPTQTWPVRVAPDAYYLFDARIPSVPELCDAFKYRYLHQSNLASAGPKTPFGSRTPARMTPGHRTPAHRTPSHVSSKQPFKPSYEDAHQPPSGMNPQRQAMIQSGWGQSTDGSW